MPDCEFLDIDITEFLTRIERNMTPGVRLPLFGTLELTPYCNVKCVHCYVTNCEYTDEVLSYQEVCRILDEVVEAGCTWLLFTGGEPLLRKDFVDIYTYAKKKGLLLTVFTNGTLVTPEIAHLFHDLPPRLVEISIYGATEETHDKITGVKGSFKNCLRGIKLLLDQDVRLRLKTMAMTLNVHEINAMKELAETLGVKFRFDPILNPVLDGSREPYRYRLSPEQVVDLDKEDPERAREWISTFETMDRNQERPDTLYICGVGRGRFHIDAFGKLQLCTIARRPEYDLRKGSFYDGWHNFLTKIRD